MEESESVPKITDPDLGDPKTGSYGSGSGSGTLKKSFTNF
jgi:hypothetical protein